MDLLKAIAAQWNPFSNQEAAVQGNTFPIGVLFHVEGRKFCSFKRCVSCPHTEKSDCIKSILSYANDSVTEL